MSRLGEIGGRRLPFLRWSFVRMLLGMKRLTTEWQVGDGREEALAAYVTQHARPGDLDDALRRAAPQVIVELGTYCGYSALRMARAMPDGARLVSIEFNADNAAIARRIWDHAGITDRVTVVVGTLGDGGATADALEAEHGIAPGSVGFVFLDHDKDAYLADIRLIVERGWLGTGAVAVADNIKFPGAPEYRAFMTDQEGTSWRTTEHATHVEYQSLIKDLVLESVNLGA